MRSLLLQHIMSNNFDIIVIGAGHAGIEAALASARIGANTALFVIKMETIGLMSCNPTIGGPAKGHLAIEIDALGGEIGVAADSTGIHFRMLNIKKGPAVWSPRTQNDRDAYSKYMRRAVETQVGLSVIESQVVELLVQPDISSDKHVIRGVKTVYGKEYFSNKVIIATGTFQNGTVHVGDRQYNAGRSGEPADMFLTSQLHKLGFKTRRFKTGTPPRVDITTVNLDLLEKQNGDQNPIGFSHFSDIVLENKICCYLTHTTKETHDIIRENLALSSMYGGYINAVGARYCPSIEDKIVKFSDKEQHQIFIEHEGLNTVEAYVNGLSNSLPAVVQDKIISSIPCLKNAKIMRYGYAIEYDCIYPEELYPSLESKRVSGLYFAGQINGTSGYEEAAAQGLVAGVNATCGDVAAGLFQRSSSYIGVLIDDLVTKGTNEPYRLFTSRAEHRLYLRHDNADDRLMESGYKIGLVKDIKWNKYLQQKSIIEREINNLKSIVSTKSTEISQPTKLINLLKRPEISYESLVKYGYTIPDDVSEQIKNKINVLVKYEGYLKRQEEEIKRFSSIENIKIPNDIDFLSLEGLSMEAREKINNIRPISIGQASRISGVNFTDVQALMLHIRRINE